MQDIRRVTIWGNHSSTQYPDIAHATVKGAPVSLDEEWVQAVFVPTVQKRGAAVIAARKLSSAMSAAKVPYHNNKDLGRENGGRLLDCGSGAACVGIRYSTAFCQILISIYFS